jgi:hypothetical protein
VRFSLKWILAGTLYVAIAAAAFGTAKWYFADVLWALTVLTFVYAIGIVSFAKGKQRAMAWTLVVGCVCYLACLVFAKGPSPTTRLMNAAGFDSKHGPTTVIKEPIPPGTSSPAFPAFATNVAVTSDSTGQQYLSYNVQKQIDFNDYVRAANAVATLAFGLMGSLVGLMAFQASAVEDGQDPTKP